MGKYSGIFLCSDFDGTLAVNGTVPQDNIDAIKHFTDNGGIFSVVSGRNIGFLLNYREQLCLNSYVACLNGSAIYKLPERTPIQLSYLPRLPLQLMTRTVELLENAKDIHVMTGQGSFLVDILAPDRDKRLGELLSLPVHKILIHAKSAIADDTVEAMRELFGERFEIVRSWESGVEICDALSNKGTAAKKMAALVGAERLICVGDYENDISMIRAADVSYAVGNALPALKKLAMHTTATASDAAIAAIIAQL